MAGDRKHITLSYIISIMFLDKQDVNQLEDFQYQVLVLALCNQCQAVLEQADFALHLGFDTSSCICFLIVILNCPQQLFDAADCWSGQFLLAIELVHPLDQSWDEPWTTTWGWQELFNISCSLWVFEHVGYTTYQFNLQIRVSDAIVNRIPIEELNDRVEYIFVFKKELEISRI